MLQLLHIIQLELIEVQQAVTSLTVHLPSSWLQPCHGTFSSFVSESNNRHICRQKLETSSSYYIAYI